VEAVFQKGLRRTKMRVIGCDDGDEVDALVRRKTSFAFRHLVVRTVDARRVEKEPSPCRAGVRPVPREHASDQVDLLVQCGGDAVDAADKGAVTSADHSHSQFALSGHQWNRFHKSLVQIVLALRQQSSL